MTRFEDQLFGQLTWPKTGASPQDIDANFALNEPR
jgi:hypothetical protein